MCCKMSALQLSVSLLTINHHVLYLQQCCISVAKHAIIENKHKLSISRESKKYNWTRSVNNRLYLTDLLWLC